MASGCCGGNSGETLIFTCAGAAHSGQVANRAGIGLMQAGKGNLFCIAAVGAAIPDKMERARNAGRRVVIDGCEDHCARKIMEKAGLPVEVHVDVTELGIEKKPAEPQLVLHAKRVVEHVAETL
ncbi:MAG: putative zinc-binding protein [Planctomycetes bacterium]|nr:putative zinc-binding protein [Planctomycetota bacterium]